MFLIFHFKETFNKVFTMSQKNEAQVFLESFEISKLQH